MKLIKNIICFLCISICLLSISVRAAVVSDNDASSFVTKAEFEAYKNNVQKLIDDYNSSISSAIDGSIATYLATYDTSGASTYILEEVFPIGFIILSNQAPTYGTWQEITDSTGRCLWVDSTKTWGTTIAQAMPRPTFDVAKAGKHSHTFTGTSVTSETSGAHTHSVSGVYLSERVSTKKYTDYVVTTSADGSSATKSHTSHTHTLTASGTIDSVGAHSHTVTIASPWNGTVNSKVQPLAYTIRMWKRIA